MCAKIKQILIVFALQVVCIFHFSTASAYSGCRNGQTQCANAKTRCGTGVFVGSHGGRCATASASSAVHADDAGAGLHQFTCLSVCCLGRQHGQYQFVCVYEVYGAGAAGADFVVIVVNRSDRAQIFVCVGDESYLRDGL